MASRVTKNIQGSIDGNREGPAPERFRILRVFNKGYLHSALKGEQGITGLETALILIAFVVVATGFAFVVLTTSHSSSERGTETVFPAPAKARGTMEVRGGVIVTATG